MNEQLIQQKKELRSRMLKLRNECDVHWKEAYDQNICTELSKLITDHGFTRIHTYIPIGSEIDVRPLLEELLLKKLLVVAPKTLSGRKLENRVLRSLNELETGIMKTQHPLLREINEGPFDLILVPGLAYDERGYRLGYGGGYYDSFLASHPEAMSVGLFYPFQKVEQVPVEGHDWRMRKVVCEMEEK